MRQRLFVGWNKENADTYLMKCISYLDEKSTFKNLQKKVSEDFFVYLFHFVVFLCDMGNAENIFQMRLLLSVKSRIISRKCSELFDNVTYGSRDSVKPKQVSTSLLFNILLTWLYGVRTPIIVGHIIILVIDQLSFIFEAQNISPVLGEARTTPIGLSYRTAKHEVRYVRNFLKTKDHSL